MGSMRSRCSLCCRFFIILASALFSQSQADDYNSSGASTAWGGGWDEKYSYIVIDQDVRGVLTEVGRNLAYPIEISRDVGGRVRNGVSAESARDFLDKLSMENGIAWFFDGAMIHVNTQQELVHRRIELNDRDTGYVLSAIDDLGIGYPLITRIGYGGDDTDSSTLRVWGPPSWADRVVQILDDPLPPQVWGSSSVKVFRGSAAHIEYTD